MQVILALALTSGVSLANKDDSEHTLTYSYYPGTTAICWVAKPSSAVRKGLDGADRRRMVPGFRMLSAASESVTLYKVTAAIAGGTTTSCLCTKSCTIEVAGIGAIEARGGGEVIVIESGALRSSAPGR